MKVVVGRFPEFTPQWEAYLQRWQGESPGLSLELAEFARHIEDALADGGVEQARAMMGFVEELLVSGSEEVKNAAATSLLEHLINAAEAGRISAEGFVPLLGPESRAYCKAWDEFTGARTQGLWP